VGAGIPTAQKGAECGSPKVRNSWVSVWAIFARFEYEAATNVRSRFLIFGYLAGKIKDRTSRSGRCHHRKNRARRPAYRLRSDPAWLKSVPGRVCLPTLGKGVQVVQTRRPPPEGPARSRPTETVPSLRTAH